MIKTVEEARNKVKWHCMLFGQWIPFQDDDFRAFVNKVYDFMRDNYPDTRMYQIFDEADFEPQDSNYIVWVVKRMKQGRFPTFKPVLHELEIIAAMLEEGGCTS